MKKHTQRVCKLDDKWNRPGTNRYTRVYFVWHPSAQTWDDSLRITSPRANSAQKTKPTPLLAEQI